MSVILKGIIEWIFIRSTNKKTKEVDIKIMIIRDNNRINISNNKWVQNSIKSMSNINSKSCNNSKIKNMSNSNIKSCSNSSSNRMMIVTIDVNNNNNTVIYSNLHELIMIRLFISKVKQQQQQVETIYLSLNNNHNIYHNINYNKTTIIAYLSYVIV